MRIHCYDEKDKELLENNILSHRARASINRLLIKVVNKSNDGNINCATKIDLYSLLASNLCRNMMNFTPDDSGLYLYQEETYLNNKIPSLILDAKTLELYESLADLITQSWISREAINQILSEDGVPVHYVQTREDVIIERLQSVDEDTLTETEKHPSMQQLLDRAEDCLNRDDGAGVLHATASIFEALGKNVFATPEVQNQTLKSFFEGYKQRSHLPEKILDYIISVYDSRNKTPNAGHGSLEFSDDISKEEMVAMIELAKAAIHIEDKCR